MSKHQHLNSKNSEDGSHLSLQRKKRGMQSTFSQTPFSKGFDHSFGATPTQTGSTTSAIMRMPNPLSPASNPAGIIMRSPTGGAPVRPPRPNHDAAKQRQQQQQQPTQQSGGSQPASEDKSASPERLAPPTLNPQNIPNPSLWAPPPGSLGYVPGGPVAPGQPMPSNQAIPVPPDQMYSLPGGRIRPSAYNINVDQILDKFEDMWVESSYITDMDYNSFRDAFKNINQATIVNGIIPHGTTWWSPEVEVRDGNRVKQKVQAGLRFYITSATETEQTQGTVQSGQGSQSQSSQQSESGSMSTWGVQGQVGVSKGPASASAGGGYSQTDYDRNSDMSHQGTSDSASTTLTHNFSEVFAQVGVELSLKTTSNQNRIDSFIKNAGSVTLTLANLNMITGSSPVPILPETTRTQGGTTNPIPGELSTDTAGLDETSIIEIQVTRSANGPEHDDPWATPDEPYVKLTHAGKSKDTCATTMDHNTQRNFKIQLTQLSDYGLINQPLTIQLYDWDDQWGNPDDKMTTFTWSAPYHEMNTSGAGYSIKASLLRKVPKLYTVAHGDTLSGIAQRFYGNDDYQKIAEANPVQISDPNLISSGMVLNIP